MKQAASEARAERLRPRRTVVDCLLLGQEGVWGVLARPDGVDADLFDVPDGEQSPVPLRLCRLVGEDGTLLIGDADPLKDHWLSELMLWECCDEV